MIALPMFNPRRFILSCVCLAALWPVSASAQEVISPGAGVANFTFHSPQRERLVQAVLWFPSELGGYRDELGGNPVFKPVTARRDAFPTKGKHPLILLSHGSGGNPANISWLGQALARHGFVVAMPVHQGTTSADSTPATSPLVWQRTDDMRRLLDNLLANPVTAAMINENDVTAMGFSLGGHTALAVAGASAHVGDYARFCDVHTESMDCIWFDRGNSLIPGHVDLHKVDDALFSAKQGDPRITRFVAIDPAFAQAYDATSLRNMTLPGLVLNLADPDKIPLTVRPEKLAAALPNTRFETVAGANHFSFLAECKPLGFMWVWLEGDDPVCRDGRSRSRADIHEEIAEKILAFLKPTETQ